MSTTSMTDPMTARQHRAEMIEEFTDNVSGRYLDAAWRGRETVTPPMQTKVWVEGLKAAGVAARLGRVWRGGKYPTTLPMVVEFGDPLWHRTDDRADFQKVRLVIEDDGWWSVYGEHSCSKCSDDDITRWLVTCPACEAGRDDDEHEADECSPLFPETGSLAPLAGVVAAYDLLRRLVEARWVVGHPEEVRAEVQRTVGPPKRFAGRIDGRDWTPEEYVEHVVTRRLDDARAVLSASAPQSRALTEAAAGWTVEAVVEWLDDLTDDDGSPLVPPWLGKQKTWALVKDIPGRPGQTLVFAAQARRRERAEAVEVSKQAVSQSVKAYAEALVAENVDFIDGSINPPERAEAADDADA